MAVSGFETGRLFEHPYVRVGRGSRPPLVVIPGLNDPVLRVTGTPWFSRLLARYLRRYVDDRPVYLVSRPLDVPDSMAAMAAGYEPVLEELGPADVMGLSMGGFVVQHLAASRPDVVRKAVLALSADSLSPMGRSVLVRWRECALNDDWLPIYLDAFDALATGGRRRAMRLAGRLYLLVAPGPESPTDLLTSLSACLEYDGREVLPDVTVPTLVVGGTADPFFDPSDYRETARALPDGRLAMLVDGGHESVIMHPGAFDGPILDFLK